MGLDSADWSELSGPTRARLCFLPFRSWMKPIFYYLRWSAIFTACPLLKEGCVVSVGVGVGM